MNHEHTFCDVGLWNPDKTMSVPCVDCYDEKIVKDGQDLEIIEDGFKPSTHGVNVEIASERRDGISKIVLREIERDYQLNDIQFKSDRPRIIDIGAHIGLVSVFLAKYYPTSTVESYEPNPDNYSHLVKNIKANRLRNVKTHHAAVTGDGRGVIIQTVSDNSGQYSIYKNGGKKVHSVSIAKLLNKPIDLLKIDCEGAEYEIFDALTDEQIKSIGAIRGEFHQLKGDGITRLSDLYSRVFNLCRDFHVSECRL